MSAPNLDPLLGRGFLRSGVPMPDLSRINVTAYTVGCYACGWIAQVRPDQLEQIDAHRMPVLFAVRHRLDGGATETWRCRKPRVLR